MKKEYEFERHSNWLRRYDLGKDEKNYDVSTVLLLPNFTYIKRKDGNNITIRKMLTPSIGFSCYQGDRPGVQYAILEINSNHHHCDISIKFRLSKSEYSSLNNHASSKDGNRIIVFFDALQKLDILEEWRPIEQKENER